MSRFLIQRERTMLEEAGWPPHLLEDPAKQPRAVYTADDFAYELLLGEHIEEVIVLPNGVELLGLQERRCLSQELHEAVGHADSVMGFLEALDRESLESLQGNLELIDSASGVQKDALEVAEDHGLVPFGDTEAAARDWWQQPGLATGELPPQNVSALAVLARASLSRKVDAARALQIHPSLRLCPMYICELRWRDARPHPFDGKAHTSCCVRHCCHSLGVLSDWTLRWSCDDDGLFVGYCGSGKGLHVDQRPESNVGKNWKGYKLFAIWPAGEPSNTVLQQFHGEVFQHPLSQGHMRALEQAKRIVLLRAGDVFLFNGGLAHTTLCVSRDLGLTGYEGLLSLTPPHIIQFLRSCDEFAGDWKQVASSWKVEVAEACAELARSTVASYPKDADLGMLCSLRARAMHRSLSTLILPSAMKIFCQDALCRASLYSLLGPRNVKQKLKQIPLRERSVGVQMRSRNTCSLTSFSTYDKGVPLLKRQDDAIVFRFKKIAANARRFLRRHNVKRGISK